MSGAAPRVPLPRTTAEFLNWPGDGRAKHYQLVDGEVRAMAPGSTTHGTIQSNLTILIGSHLRSKKPTCRVLTTPGVVPRLNANQNFRVPDLGVTCSPDIAKQIVMSEPLLLVEILSPSNAAKTWTNVWAYSTIPGLREILVVHSARRATLLLSQLPDGAWPDSPTKIDDDGTLVLDSIGLICPIRDIYVGTHLARNGPQV